MTKDEYLKFIEIVDELLKLIPTHKLPMLYAYIEGVKNMANVLTTRHEKQ